MAPRSISTITKCYLPRPCLMSGPLLSGQNFVMVIRIFAYEVRKLGLITYKTKYQSVIITDRCIELRSNCYLLLLTQVRSAFKYRANQ